MDGSVVSFSWRMMLQAARLHNSLQQPHSGGVDDAEADAVHLFCGLWRWLCDRAAMI